MRHALLLNYLLFASAVGLSVAYNPLFRHGGSVVSVLLGTACLGPFFAVFALHFTNRPLFSFTVHHRVWAAALALWVLAVIGAEVVLNFGPSPESPNVNVLVRVLIHSAWLAFVPLYGSWRLGWSPYGGRAGFSGKNSEESAV